MSSFFSNSEEVLNLNVAPDKERKKEGLYIIFTDELHGGKSSLSSYELFKPWFLVLTLRHYSKYTKGKYLTDLLKHFVFFLLVMSNGAFPLKL